MFPAQLLWHRGHGQAHADLVLGQGGRCPTLTIMSPQRITWNLPHRRAWLTRSGPVSGGRGSTTRLWRGLATWQGRRRLLLPGAAITWRGGAVACTGWLAMLGHYHYGRLRHLNRI